MTRPPFEKPLRWYTWKRKVYLTYRMVYSEYLNKHFDNQPWHCWEEWAIFVGLSADGDPWFDYEDLYYDGNTVQMLTIFGIVFGKLYGYDARAKDQT